MQPRTNTGEATVPDQVADLRRAETTQGQIKGPGEAINPAYGAKNSPWNGAQVVWPGGPRKTSTGDHPTLGNPKTAAAPILTSPEGHDQVPAELEQPTIHARRRPGG
jgi:hypothetical protein